MKTKFNNDDRADRALNAIRCCQDHNHLDADDQWETPASDLLANLMHLCRREDVEFYDLVGRGEIHFTAEVEEEQEES